MAEFLGLCTFPLFQRFDADVWADLYSALTGIEIGSAGLLRAAERAWDVRKAFNVREGASRKDDLALKRFTTEPVKVGEEMYDFVDEKYFDKLVTEYYQERGWDPKEGTVSKERLKELGL